ncbi:N-acetylglucosamine kinase [Aequorivita marina]|uniref:N-acetylglucosamine kinase n=1 Tax=Aequorivita marina TaxID=3073654 RepID=UPI00287498EF|nr:N-acetylglucosamine kinase [Aequorivita sp. S2608]MDS1299628.1 N-acetylglucosamine kinase [Aequorivita sp. S2608]
MTLITDSGSTKCDWVLLDAAGNVVLKTKTKGLNPAIIDAEELHALISENLELVAISNKVEVLDFYGAGCGTSIPCKDLKGVLTAIFPNAKIMVQEDLAAAVFAATTEPGIVCILGTGSNSCYFDGEEIHAPIASLGYALMDEASGNYFGKRLIRDYYYKRMPAEIASEFEKSFNLDADEIKKNLYKTPNPNAYLASFAQFIFANHKITPYFHNLIKEGIEAFITCRVLTFKEAHRVPIHFIGSIAHFSQEIIKESLHEHNLSLGNIVQRPIDGLIGYYKNKITE